MALLGSENEHIYRRTNPHLIMVNWESMKNSFTVYPNNHVIQLWCRKCRKSSRFIIKQVKHHCIHQYTSKYSLNLTFRWILLEIPSLSDWPSLLIVLFSSFTQRFVSGHYGTSSRSLYSRVTSITSKHVAYVQSMTAVWLPLLKISITIIRNFDNITNLSRIVPLQLR